MAERPEDLNLPNSVIARIIKDALPAGVVVSKDTRVAISKAASVFVLYATSCANGFAMTNKRKTISGRDVLDAMDEMDFEKFIEPLKKSLEAYRQEQKNKKDSANKKKEQAAEKAEQGDGDGKENGSPEDDEEVMLIESESISDEEEEAEEEEAEAEAEEEEGDE